VDYDPAYLYAERFPLSTRVLIESFDAIPDLGITPDDYVCVLTRGHMFDPQALIYGIRSGAGYVGMMGTQKNARVFELAETMASTEPRLKPRTLLSASDSVHEPRRSSRCQSWQNSSRSATTCAK